METNETETEKEKRRRASDGRNEKQETDAGAAEGDRDRSSQEAMGRPYGVIYRLTNTVTGKVYVGQTVMQLRKRLNAHFRSPNCRLLAFSLKKHGRQSFVLDTLATAYSRQELNALETEWIVRLGANVRTFGYNLSTGGDGKVFSDESRQRLSAAHKKRWGNTESRARQSETMKESKGSPEARAKHSAAMKAHWATKTQEEKHRIAMKAVAARAGKVRARPVLKQSITDERRRMRTEMNAARWENTPKEQRSAAASAAAKARWDKPRKKKTK